MEKQQKTVWNQLKKILLILCGWAAVGLGILGVVLPILPTTPFLLVAAACFVRSSERFYDWLLNNRWFGDLFRNYKTRQGIPLKVKIIAICMLWLAISYSALVWVPLLVIKLFLFAIAIGVTMHISSIKTLQEK